MSNRFETLAAWLDWLTRLHPKRMDLGLERVATVWSRLGPKPPPFPVITVGGTNGKGSCATMMEAMLQAAGYRSACYSSPHLVSYNERVRLGGEPVSDALLCQAFERVESARDAVRLTYFEFGTLAALDLFVREAPDLAILEVGLGGRLDAVNLLDAEVAVVTSIGHDHTAWLGDSLEKIAREKAGIFRHGRPAVIGQRDAPLALREAAAHLGAEPMQLGLEFEREPATAGWVWRGPEGERLALPAPALRGNVQMDNAATAVAALRTLGHRLPLPVNAIRAGLQRARLPGRFQVIPGRVNWILDVAHNGEAAQALAANLRAFACPGRLRAVIAILADKQPEAIVAPLLPLVADWYLTQSADARALAADQLAARLAHLLPGSAAVLADLDQALDAANRDASPGDCLLVVGSFTTVGRALERLPDT